MKLTKLISTVVFAVVLTGFSAGLAAHESGPGDIPDEIIVTRHFTGIWDQVDQEAQGLALQVVEQLDDSRKAVVYWYTYGEDRKSAWFVGAGNLVDNRIELELFESSDVGFMQNAVPGNDSVDSIGTMTIAFDSCDSGSVTFDTDVEAVGSGTFKIERLLEIMNTHCSGGISDDMHSDAIFGEQRVELLTARDGITGNGHARYEDFPGHMEFEIDVEGLSDDDYHLYVGMQDRGVITVQNGRGELIFTSPGETGRRLMTFDPRGMLIEIHDGQGAVLSSFSNLLEDDDHGHHGGGAGHDGDEDHNYDCAYGSGGGHGGMGGGMGGGMHGDMDYCVEEGDFIELQLDLENTGVISSARGEAKWEMNTHRVEFSVEIEDVPAGSYPLHVGGMEVGVINAFEMHGGGVFGHIAFRDPEISGRGHLDFEPRGQKIEVFQSDTAILEVDFPTE